MKEYIRTARPTDFERISDVGASSMMDNPLINYFGCTTPDLVKAYIFFILNISWQAGGVIDVTCIRGATAHDTEDIASVAIWLPPGKRVNRWNIYNLLRSGAISLSQKLGAQSITRLGWEYPNSAVQSWIQSGLYGMADGPEWTQKDTWYLKLAFTAKRYQSQGLMTNMIRGRLDNNPSSAFTLEATSAKAEIFFRRTFDFEILNRINLGAGQVNESGDVEDRGVGIDVYSMIKGAVPA